VCAACLAASGVANAATLTLAWDPSAAPDVAGYVLYWGTHSGVYGNSLDVGNQTQQPVAGLADNTTYYFVVRAYNSASVLSPPSNEATGTTPPAPAPGPGACGSCGDFNGDRTPDLLFQNDTTRQVAVWYLGGPPADAPIGWNWLASTGVTGWRLVSAADFNGDGKPDLVWQNDSTRQAVVWYMSGSGGNTPLGWDWLPTAGDGWRLVDAVDLNRDGKPDLVWQNDATFQAVVSYLSGSNGNTLLGWDWLATSGVDGWRLVATGDFNGDGTPDLVWQNSNRQVLVWYMGGTQGSVYQSWAWLSASSQVGWTIVGTNDFNGDGKPDLVWQNDGTREVAVWYMGGSGGSVFQGTQSLASTGVAGWTAVAR
jgi:hypothetical protein